LSPERRRCGGGRHKWWLHGHSPAWGGRGTDEHEGNKGERDIDLGGGGDELYEGPEDKAMCVWWPDTLICWMDFVINLSR
jgi:Ca2+-binding RTX toxin-like protein